MRILLTGAAGFLSSHLIPAFLARGDEVIAQDIVAPTNFRERHFILSAKVREYRWKSVADVTAADLEGIDVVVHTAGVADVPLSNTSPRYTYQANVDSMMSLVMASRQTKTPILALSTENVYGAVPPDRLPAKETEPCWPKNAYAASKVAMEALLHAYSYQFEFPAAVIRSSTLFGERMRTGQVVSIFMRQALANEPITIEGTGYQTRDFNYVGNMVQAILRVTSVFVSSPLFHVWNIGSGVEVTLREFADLVLEVTGSSSGIIYEPWRPGEEGRLSISIEKARRELGYEPFVTVKEGLEKLAVWMRKS